MRFVGQLSSPVKHEREAKKASACNMMRNILITA